MVTATLKDHYQTLGVGETASYKEIKKRYWSLAKKYHPDNGSEPDEDKFKEVSEAWEVLSKRREAYDEERASASSSARESPPASKHEADSGPRDWEQELFDQWGLRSTRMWENTRARQYCRPFEPTDTRESLRAQAEAQGIRRTITILVCVVVAALIFVPLLSHPGSSGRAASSTPPAITTLQQMAASEATKRQTAAEHRIARLSLMCIDRYVCANDPDGHPVPIFVSGIDENLRVYLQKQGYKDEWTDSGGQIHGQTIGPNSEPQGEFAYGYVASAKEVSGPADEHEPTNVETGMMYHENREHGSSEANGIIPWDVRGSVLWTVTWTLMNPSGQTVKALSYSVQLANCEGTGEQYCEKVIDYEEEAPPGESVVYGGSYSAAHYKPPPAFEKSRGEGE